MSLALFIALIALLVGVVASTLYEALRDYSYRKL